MRQIAGLHFASVFPKLLVVFQFPQFSQFQTEVERKIKEAEMVMLVGRISECVMNMTHVESTARRT